MARPGKVANGLSLVLLIGVVSAFMYLVTTFLFHFYLVTTFLFHFSGGQFRMGPVVDFGALAVVTGTLLLAVIVWKIRSPAAAVKYTFLLPLPLGPVWIRLFLEVVWIAWTGAALLRTGQTSQKPAPAA